LIDEILLFAFAFSFGAVFGAKNSMKVDQVYYRAKWWVLEKVFGRKDRRWRW
jgi:hypothetical protein